VIVDDWFGFFSFEIVAWVPTAVGVFVHDEAYFVLSGRDVRKSYLEFIFYLPDDFVIVIKQLHKE
jgi:hypothetical protein